jgi:hypothetical protein
MKEAEIGSRPAPAKMFARSQLSGKELGVVVCVPVTPETVGSLK